MVEAPKKLVLLLQYLRKTAEKTQEAHANLFNSLPLQGSYNQVNCSPRGYFLRDPEPSAEDNTPPSPQI